MLNRIIIYTLFSIGSLGVFFSSWSLLHRHDSGTLHSEKAASVRQEEKLAIIGLSSPARVGEPISSGMLKSIEVSASLKPADAILDTLQNRKAIIGSYLRRAKNALSFLTNDDLVVAQDLERMASHIAPGNVGYVLPISEDLASTNAIHPGDLVDVMLSYRPVSSESGAIIRYETKWIVKRVRVASVGDALTQDASDAHFRDKLPRSITLDLTPGQARDLAVGARIGDLTPVLCASSMDDAVARLQDAPDAVGESASSFENKFYKSEIRRSLRVYSGDKDTKDYSW